MSRLLLSWFATVPAIMFTVTVVVVVVVVVVAVCVGLCRLRWLAVASAWVLCRGGFVCGRCLWRGRVVGWLGWRAFAPGL